MMLNAFHQVLEDGGADPRGGFLILITDGEENHGTTRIPDTLDDIKRAGIIIDTIAFEEADEQVEDLARMTGGNSAACPDGGSAQCVSNAFSSSVTKRSDSFSTATPIQVICAYNDIINSFETMHS